MKSDLEFSLIPACVQFCRKLIQIGSSAEGMKRQFNRTVKNTMCLSMKITWIIAVILMAVLQTSCVVYVPNVINTPLLSDKGEVQANLNIGVSGFDPQLSAAVSDHVGLMFNGSFRFNTNSNSAYEEVHNFVEAGAGYFTEFEEKGRFEVYGGVGGGNLKASNVDFWTSGPDIEVKTFRAFVQPGVGFKTDNFEGSFASRLVLLNLDLGTETATNFFIEPAFTIKGGSKNIKAVFQIGVSIPTGYHYDNFYNPTLFSMGIQGTFGRKNTQAK
jgi:hypothetical protein